MLYQLTPEAEEDLELIYDYTIEQWGKSQANKYHYMLFEAINTLALIPTIGRPRADIDEYTYSYNHASHVIYYHIFQEKPIIIAILHKRMSPIEHLEQR